MEVFTLMWDVLMLFKFIFEEVEAFVYKCEAFVKIERLLKDIFRELEAFFNEAFYKHNEAF
jgi:hypothetical protein